MRLNDAHTPAFQQQDAPAPGKHRECPEEYRGCACSPAAEVICRWYHRLSFPKSYDSQFETILRTVKIPDSLTAQTLDTASADGERNLLSCLFLCGALERQYEEKGIGGEILLDTLGDIVVYTKIWSELKGSLHLENVDWLKYHLSMKLFKLGRLQFCMAQAGEDLPGTAIRKGDNVMEVHIDEKGRLDPAACDASFAMAERFFARYYPEFQYDFLICHSWLLASSLDEFAAPESNILRFRSRFTVVREEASDEILRYVFRWDTTRSTVCHALCGTDFARRVKARALAGGVFHEATGVMRRADAIRTRQE